MAVMDEFKEERAKVIKDGTFQEKWNYFWDYYKWHVIAITLITVFAVWIIHDVVTQEENVLYAALLNCSSAYDTSEYVAGVEEALGVESGEYLTIEATLDVTEDSVDYTSQEALMVRIAAKEVDVMVAEEETISRYAEADVLIDLTTILSEEQLERYSAYFYYIDYALIESGYYDETNYEDEVAAGTADHASPENMEQPIAVGIYIATTDEAGDYVCTTPEFNANYYYSTEAIFTITNFSGHIDAALQFLDYICGYGS